MSHESWNDNERLKQGCVQTHARPETFGLPGLPTPSSQQPPMALGTLPMSLAAISDKIWDWNPIVPDAAA